MQVRESWNPLVLDHDREFLCVEEGLSPNQLIQRYGLPSTRRVLCLVESKYGGGYWSRQDWDCPVPNGATVRFVELPRGGGDSNPLQIIATIALIALSVYTGGLATLAFGAAVGAAAQAGVLIAGSLLLNMFFGSGAGSDSTDVGTPNPIYSINAGGNGLRIGQPFAECFGYFKRFPDLIQLSYVSIENNEQYLYFYMIIGVGHYQIHGVYLDETPLMEYEGASYNILPPGIAFIPGETPLESIPTIVTNVVWTCPEINGQDISVDWLTVVVSARGTKVEQIEYDVLFNALVGYNDEGDRYSVSVTIVAEARLVNDEGTATTAWAPVHSRTYSAASKDPLRYSNKVPTPFGPGRYQFRIRRNAPPSTDTKVANKAVVTGLRGYGPRHPYYGDVTCIEGRVKATDKLSGEVVNKINVVATRKLYPVGLEGFGYDLVPTTSIFDAIAYMVTSQNGGRQPLSFIKWDVLLMLKTNVDYFGHAFNYVFSSQGAVMDACKKAAQCSRMVPYLPGGQFCLVRDDYQALPAATFTDDDIDEGSLKMTYTLATPDSPTCVRVNFLNPAKWTDDFVVYYDERGSEEITYELTLEGCLSRQQAYEHAAYLYNDMFNNGVNVEFTTGLKGHIPSLFKKLAIGATHVDWGQSGKIAAVEPDLIWLSEPVDFKDQLSGMLYISEPDGSAGGPYEVTPTANPHCVAGTILGLKTIQDDDLKASSYLFGPASTQPIYIRLMGIQPQARNKVRLFGTIIDDATYDIPGSAPSPPDPYPPGVLLASVALSRSTGDELLASWTGTSTVFKVEVSLGSGYTTIEDPYLGYSITFPSAATHTTVKVTPYFAQELITAQALTAEVIMTQAPANIVVVTEVDKVTATWTAVAGAAGYNVAIEEGGVVKGTRYVEATTSAVTMGELAAMGGPWPEFTVQVAAMVGGVLGAWGKKDVVISPMAAPSTPTLQSTLTSAVIISWGAVTGATGYKLYHSSSAGFDPGIEGTLVYNGTNLSATVAVSLTTPYAHYFKVAATNGYYQDVIDLVFSDQLGVTG